MIGMGISPVVGGFVPSGGDSDPIGTALRADAVAYWKMEEASGARADATGRDNNLSPLNVSSAVGKIGNSVEFDEGVEVESYLQSATPTELTTDGDFSISFWIYFNSQQDGSDKTLFVRNNFTEFDVKSFFSIALQKFVIAFYVTESGVDKEVISTFDISLGTWHHFYISYDSGNPSTLTIIANNETATTFNGTGGLSSDPDSITSIGGYVGFPGFSPDGRIDEAGYWKRLLTADERAYLYNSGSGRTLYP